MYSTPQTYKEGMEEMVKWANNLPENISKRFMLDLYKIYIDWRYIFETSPEEEHDNTNNS
jgi:hypothetical protein